LEIKYRTKTYKAKRTIQKTKNKKNNPENKIHIKNKKNNPENIIHKKQKEQSRKQNT
jgi:hypothetical protein